MRDYGRVAPQFWTGTTGRALRTLGGPTTAYTALYLMTCPSATMIGLYYLPRTSIAEETGLTPKAVASALGHLESAGFAYYDTETAWVWVPKMLRFQIGHERITRAYKQLHGPLMGLARKASASVFFPAFLALYRESYDLYGFPDTPVGNGPIPEQSGLGMHSDSTRMHSLPFRSIRQEQEQEQEQEQGQEQGQGQGIELSPPASASQTQAAFAAFWAAWPASRRVERRAALEQWTKLNPDAALARVIIAAVERIAGDPHYQAEGFRFLKHPHRWLRDRRWEDAVPAAGPAGLFAPKTAGNLAAGARALELMGFAPEEGPANAAG